MWDCLRMWREKDRNMSECLWIVCKSVRLNTCAFVGVICWNAHYCTYTRMNTDETSNCHEVCPVFNWYNKHVPPHATRMFNKIFQDKNYFRSHYTVKCSPLVPMKCHHTSTPPGHNNALCPGWQAFKNSVVVWSFLLHSEPCTNSKFHFPVSVQSAIPNCRLSRPANDGPSGQGQERRVDAWFHASAAKSIRTAPFWVIMQLVVVISYRHFGTIYRTHLQGVSDGTDRLSRNVGRKFPLLAA